MNLKDLPFPVFGDTTFRGKCPREGVEQSSFFNRLRTEYPKTWGLIALHPRNEALLIGGQFSSVTKHRVEGMAKGASDVIIPGYPSLVIEIKRQDHTLSKWEDDQIPYLTACHNAGAFACVALGAVGAWEAFEMWLVLLADNGHG